jgi:hypothetical protein
VAVNILSTILGGGVGELFSKIVGTFKLSPEKAAELEAAKEAHAVELQKLEYELQDKLQDAMSREIEAASANIRAEATNGDKYTSRSRPSFIYVMLAIFICNYMIFPIIGRPAIAFPEPLFWLFGSCMLGYTGARTWEKIAPGVK